MHYKNADRAGFAAFAPTQATHRADARVFREPTEA